MHWKPRREHWHRRWSRKCRKRRGKCRSCWQNKRRGHASHLSRGPGRRRDRANSHLASCNPHSWKEPRTPARASWFQGTWSTTSLTPMMSQAAHLLQATRRAFRMIPPQWGLTLQSNIPEGTSTRLRVWTGWWVESLQGTVQAMSG